VPVSTVNAQRSSRWVTSNVLEILRKDLPSFSGRSNAGSSNANNTNQNTGGGSQVQLRNLDTLVLIDGRVRRSTPLLAWAARPSSMSA